jgi:uncharacterized protein YbcC (UPF0753/DUF2309 family)
MTCLMTADDLRAAMRAAADAVPPAWPLAATVAVNPFLGQAGEDLAHVAARLGRIAGVATTMPRDWYAARIAVGAITDDDLAGALDAAGPAQRPVSLAALMGAVGEPMAPPAALPTVADLAAAASGIDWPAIIADRFGTWAAGWFDEGQALWAAPQGRSAYVAWRAAATHDLTPEILGLRGFATTVAAAPEIATAALSEAAARLGVPAAGAASYFHQLLTTVGGWAQAARYRRWQAELNGGDDETIDDFLTIRLHWDAVLLVQYGAAIGEQWASTLEAHAAPLVPNAAQVVDAILQEAAERAAQRAIAATLARAPTAAQTVPPELQVAFCIDVRSEVIRRALEALDPRIQTLGFAGFFGLAASHFRLGSDVAEHRLPVLLNPGLVTRAGGPTDRSTDAQMRLGVRVIRAWERFKLAAISSFAFVEAAAPTYMAKLIRDALSMRRATPAADPAPQPDPALDPAAKVTMAATILHAMGLTDGFAPLVVLAGHGASVVNNPHASALQCGACGGYSGEVNARLLAAFLTDPNVRTGLVDRGILIPATTRFVAALHDTTTDAIGLYAADEPGTALTQARDWFAAAGGIARGERALRLPRAASSAAVARRSYDWAETRPEWALAGAQAFIAAPRARTRGRDLAGRAFLHDYDWHRDPDFGVLELIMTAPIVVASWISLQYYGSTVAPALFGGGNKLIHNVVGGMGVVEGNGGTLRTGLPWQSVHDGDRLAHEPLRLTVAIEAPRDAITAVLDRHPGLHSLFDNRWMHLFALDDAGRMTWRYAGNLRWEPEANADHMKIRPAIAA